MPGLEHLETRLAPAASVAVSGWNALGDHPDTSGRREVVVVDPRVPDEQILLSGLQPGTQVVMLSASSDALTQIADALAGPAQTTDVHILGHGSAGQMLLGDGILDTTTLASDSAAVSRLAGELGPDSDLLLYGCQTGAGTPGTALVEALAQATGMAVAASSNYVGSASLGGGWQLDVTSGKIDAASVLSQASLAEYPDRLNGPSLTPTTLPGGILGQSYTETLSATGGTAPVTYAVSAGSLPTGLTLNTTTGVISGTPITSPLTTLSSFPIEGRTPNALVEDSSGNFYGTTSAGGLYSDGTVFEIAANTNILTTLVSFNGTDGLTPGGGLLVDSSGNIFGTTSAGGASNDGTVFELAAGSHLLTTVYSFSSTGGYTPLGGLVEDSSGNIFGTTQHGGASSDGTVFKISAGTHTFSTVVSFAGTSNGAQPYSTLYIDGSGNIFGTTYTGGANNDGTVFEIAAGTTTISTLVVFNGTNGDDPKAGLVEDANGNLFGTTYGGGTNGDGTVFEIAAGTDNFTTLVEFAGISNGSDPEGALALDSSGDLFGTTSAGGSGTGTSNDGLVFEVSAGTHVLSTVATFKVANGYTPTGGLLIDSHGDLFGTTPSGGPLTSNGTVFEVLAGSNTITTFAAFTAGPYGATPVPAWSKTVREISTAPRTMAARTTRAPCSRYLRVPTL